MHRASADLTLAWTPVGLGAGVATTVPMAPAHAVRSTGGGLGQRIVRLRRVDVNKRATRIPVRHRSPVGLPEGPGLVFDFSVTPWSFRLEVRSLARGVLLRLIASVIGARKAAGPDRAR